MTAATGCQPINERKTIMTTILESKALIKDYSTGKNQSQRVLHGISVAIKETQLVSIMGPSGSGKSTLLYNISGMDKATSGHVIFDGKELTSMNEEELAKLRLFEMGFVFQQSNLLKNLNLLDNIIVGSYHRKNVDRNDLSKRAMELMEKTGVAELAGNDVTQASGGQLQRVAICRALINQPKILFGDEPTGALNSKSTNEILDIFDDINRDGTTVIMATHDVKVAARSERVLFMLDGEITGDYKMSKYNKSKDDLKKREEELSSWLVGKGF